MDEVGKINLPSTKTCYRMTVINKGGIGRELIHRSMEENKNPRNKDTQICLMDFWQRWKSNSINQREFFQQVVLEQMDVCKPKQTEKERTPS